MGTSMEEIKFKEITKELDDLATLMLEPDINFFKLREIWNNNMKYRIMSGGLND